MFCAKLFDVKRRPVGSPPWPKSLFKQVNDFNHGEYNYQSVRTLLNRWYARLPKGKRADIRARFRSSDNGQHLGAFFEVFCHQYLKRMGFGVTVEPLLASLHPDFLLKKNGFSVYLEAATFEPGDEQVAAVSFGRPQNLAKAITKKCGKYESHLSRLGVGIILAVDDCTTFGTDDVLTQETLFGQLQYRWSVDISTGAMVPGTERTQFSGMGRVFNGGKAQNRYLAGVLAFRSLYPFDMDIQPTLYHNPFSKVPLDPKMFPVRQVRYVKGQAEIIPAIRETHQLLRGVKPSLLPILRNLLIEALARGVPRAR